MKTLSLLLCVTIAVTATAQQRANSVVFSDYTLSARMAHEPEAISVRPVFGRNEKVSGRGEKTTGSTNRWYNYGDYLATASTESFSAIYLWNDTTSVDAYSNGMGTGQEYLFNNMVSVGLVCDPFYYGWNDVSTYSGMMELTPTNAYTIDSVFISGIYYRNNAHTMPVDTLTVAVMYGDGTSSSDLHYKAVDTSGGRSWIYNEFGVDSLYYMNMHHDSINNHVDTFAGGMAPVVKKIYLASTDTSVDYQAVIPVSINVPAGNRPAVSVSFKSGDPSFTFGDTVFQSNGVTAQYKYGMFRPFLAYEGTSGTPAFPTNSKDDLSEGLFRDEGANRVPGNLYRPQWFWYDGATGGASTYQYPYFAFHINCPTCNTVGVNKVTKNIATVNVFPNPASSQVNILFSMANASDVLVTITNMIGQQVAVKNISGTQSGKAVFNTADLPGGMYIYTLNANGERMTGRFVVAH